MEGIVSLLDSEHYRLTERLWAELESTFGLRGIYITPFPHFSYHVAQDYEAAKLEPMLKQLTQSLKAFRVQASGLGVFTGPSPVLYIPVVRTSELSQLHEALWQATEGSLDIPDYYRPENWLPHITLAFGDIYPDTLPEVMRLLGERPLNWEITVDNLAFIEKTAQGQQVRFRFSFEG